MSKKKHRQTAEDIVKWAESKGLPPIEDLVLPVSVPGIEKLTFSQRKVLAVVVLPQTAELKSPEIAKLVGVTSQYVNRLKSKPHFIELAHQVCRQLIKQYAFPALSRYYKLAVEEGDRIALERLLVQAGILDVERSSGQGEGIGELNININLQELREQKFAEGIDRVAHLLLRSRN